MRPIPVLTIDDQFRFWEKVLRKDKNRCWIWLGAKTTGKGTFYLQGQHYYASRVSYRLHYDVDPGELQVLHECNNPLCVNPKCLYLGTVSDNMQHAFDCDRKSHKGEDHNQAKLSNKDVEDIQNSSLSNAELMRKYDVGRVTIWRARTGRWPK